MKTITKGTATPGVRWISLVGFALTALLFFTTNGLANPRPPLLQMPEIAWPLYHETFDEAFYYGMTNAQVTVGKYTLVEGFSGFALQRAGDSVTPFVLPGVEGGRTNFYCDNDETFRFWFSPYWSSGTQTNGAGPGALGVLLELDAIAGKDYANGFSLEVNAAGTVISLITQSDDQPTLLLQTEINWQANHAHLIFLVCGPKETALFLDGQLSALGAGVPSVPPQLAAVFIGSGLAGKSVAWGDFDELCCFSKPPGARFYHPLTEADLLFYWNYYARSAMMGPLSSGEIAAREKRLAALRAQRAAALSALGMDGGGMEAMAMRGTYGAVSDCVTNVPVYMTNVWAGFETNGTVTVTFDVVGTNGLIYDVLGTTNLASGPWFFVTNTPTCSTVVILNQAATQTYYLLRSTQDSDGSGFPDWWQLQYFGHTGVDPYGDDDGDGWSNLQEYQNQTNPKQFNTPPPPQGFSAIYNRISGKVNVHWQPSAGSVSGYTLVRHDPHTGNQQTNTFSANVSSYVDNSPITNIFPRAGAPTYTLQANYSSGNSITKTVTMFDPNTTVSAQLGVGPQNNTVLFIGSPIPSGITTLRLTASYLDWNINGFTNRTFDLSANSVTNNVANVPQATVDEWSDLNVSYLVIQTEDTDGDVSDMTQLAGSFQSPPLFFDGRQQLKQNLIFLLRAATVNYSFAFNEVDNGLLYFTFSSPMNCAVASYYDVDDYQGPDAYLNVFQPFANNYLFRNFVFSFADVNTNGGPTTGVNTYYAGTFTGHEQSLVMPPTYLFQTPSNNLATIPALLPTNQTRWLYSTVYASEKAYHFGGSGSYITNNTFNIYGLPYVSLLGAFGTTNGLGTNLVYYTGSLVPAAYSHYIEIAQPQLQTVDYNFWQPGVDWLPGHDEFSTTNGNHLLIASFGSSFHVAGYAKLAILNGYNNAFGYLGQYFDQAYTIGTNGIATTNSAGIVSPYGEFLPTMPGPIALVTMPDIDTGQRGTGVVQVIKLQLDVNHDGIMDLSFAGPDNTSQANPMKFWVNSDNDGTGIGQDVEVLGANVADYNYGKIRSQRNLEDFARLWVCGLPKLPTTSGYTITLSMSAVSGNPAINLYASYDTNGSTSFLTDSNAAAAQFTQLFLGNQLEFDYAKSQGTINWSQSYTLPVFSDGTPEFTHFLFEGAGIGSGQLVLTIKQGTNIIAQTSAWLDLKEVKDMFEHAHIENPPPSPPSATLADQSTYKEDNFVPVGPADGKNLIVFVHGWRVTHWDAENFAETMFKRLWWQGYQGRYAALYWPTLSSETDGPLIQYLTFNRDEYIAFKCAQGTANYFLRLQNRFPDYSINVCAHSHCNILMMETLKRHLASGQTPIHNYALLQAAVAAECLDTNAPAFLGFIYDLTPLPDSFYGYAGAVQNAISGHMVNFYNTNDFGVVTCWQPDQILLKPDGRYGYQYLPQGPSQSPIGSSRIVTDPDELMAFLSRPQTQAVGAMPNLAGPLTTSRQVDLKALVGFQGNWDEHSGEFNWNIQRLNAFYKTLGQQLGVLPEQ